MRVQTSKQLGAKEADVSANSSAAIDAIERFRALAADFKSDTAGNVVIIFGLMVTILAGMVGGAVDYGRAIHARTQMQNAMDSAVLAAARQWQVTGSQNAEAAVAHGKKIYDAMRPQDLSSVPEIAINPNDSTVVGQATAIVPSPLLAILGTSNFELNIESTALLKVGGNAQVNVEISMMLDVTGSMGWGDDKLGNMQEAAKDLISIVVWDDQSEYTSKVALVPFSKYVNVGSAYFKKVTNVTGGDSKKTCVKERSGSKRYTDAAPAGGQYFNYKYSSSCQPSQSPIMPLTSDKVALKSRIDGFQAAGGTAGHLGTAWAWYTLSPTWNDTIWSGINQPAAYPPGHDAATQGERDAAYAMAKLKKIAVLMTDGVYNTKYSGSSSNTQAKAQCDAMKAKGIEVYTIGFELPSQSARNLMEYCATDEQHFYDATDGDQLRLAFRDIALKVATLRLSK